jgi:protein O-GlcNAc transferase
MSDRPDIAALPDFLQAQAQHQAGDIAAAARLYRQLLERHGDEARLHALLGIAELQLGNLAEGVARLGRALEIDPDQPELLCNRALGLQALGRPDEALADYDRAAALQPDLLAAQEPRLGLLVRRERFTEALDACDRIVALLPDFAGAYSNRGNILKLLDRFEDAMTDYGRAIALKPDFAEAYNNRGNALKELGRPAEALTDYETAVALNPDLAEAHNNRGSVLHALQRFDEALVAYATAIAKNPGDAGAHLNRSITWLALGRLSDAAADIARARALAPDDARVISLQFRIAGQRCDWHDHLGLTAALRNCVARGGTVSPFDLLHAFDDPALHRQAATRAAGKTLTSVPRAPSAHRRLRIAYLSADFVDHVVAHQAVELFERHDRGNFETYGVCLHPHPPTGALRERLKSGFDHFREAAALSDHQIAETLAAWQIDIAVDLGGYTEMGRPRILAHRPAPLTATYLGYPGTLGADYIDYLIADNSVLPPGSEENYAEKLVRLPASFMPVDTREPPPLAGATRTAAGLPEHGFVFCAFNHPRKLTPQLFDLWMTLLRQIAGSVLWLRNMPTETADNLRREATARGVEPQRLIFAPYTATRAENFARLTLADLYLDTFPYGAHATATDFLRMGVPIVTCAGKSFASRVAAGMLTAAGLPELIAEDFAAYEAKALALARHAERLEKVRVKTSNTRHSVLFDMGRLCRNLERAYLTMWDRHADGTKPESFTIEETGATCGKV